MKITRKFENGQEIELTLTEEEQEEIFFNVFFNFGEREILTEDGIFAKMLAKDFNEVFEYMDEHKNDPKPSEAFAAECSVFMVQQMQGEYENISIDYARQYKNILQWAKETPMERFKEAYKEAIYKANHETHCFFGDRPEKILDTKAAFCAAVMGDILKNHPEIIGTEEQ